MNTQADQRKEYLDRIDRLSTEDKVRICNVMCYIMDCQQKKAIPEMEHIQYMLYGDY